MFQASLLALLLCHVHHVDQEPPAQVADLRPETAVVEYATDLGLRDRLIASMVVYADAGGFVVGELDPRLEPALVRNGATVQYLAEGIEEGAGRRLWLVPLDHAQLLTSERGADLVYRGSAFGGGGAAAIVALTPEVEALAPGRLAAAGHGRCGLGPIARQRIQPAPPLRWRGQPADGAISALAAGDPRIQTLVDQVQAANISARVQDLSSIFTRRADKPGAVTAQNDIQGWLDGLGLATSLQTFSSTYSKNVVAEIPGALHPEKVVVLGAHYDSINSQGGASATAPGADDNASGTSGVLEAARVLAMGGPYENTLRFELYSGEEFGLFGSAYAASQSKAAGQEIVAMLNMDMIAYRQAGDTRTCDFVTDNSSSSLIAFCQSTGALYVPGWASNSGSLLGGTSDHSSYNSQGFPAVFYFEDVANDCPYIHTANDTFALATNDFELARMIVQGVVATAGTLAEPVDLALTHTPLADSLDGVGPYLVTASVTSLTAAAVSSVELHYSGDGVAWSSLAMTDQGGGQYSGLIPGFGSPVTIQYWIEATDTAGGGEVVPPGAELGGPPHRFFVGQKTVIYASDFEGGSDGGWTHAQVATQDDWQRGAPQGLAGDASAAVSGTNVWANDLGESGWNGEYQPNVSNWLRSPVIDASGTTSLNLEFQRWLTVEDATYDQAQIWVGGQLVWENSAGPAGTSHHQDTSWVPVDLDITPAGAGDPSLQVEFRLLSDGGMEYGGWNIDDFAVTVKGPAPPPPPPSFSLSPSSVPSIGWVPVTASGIGMGAVLDVTVGGVHAIFEQGAGQVSFLAPPAAALGATPVVITTAAGNGSASLDVAPNAGAVLVGDAGAAPGGFFSLAAGGPGDGLAFLFYSPWLGATPIPGVVDLSIANGNFALLYSLAWGPLNPGGNWSGTFGLPNKPQLSGLALYLEGVIWQSADGSFAATGAFPFAVL